ncbi:MAG TPA: hybrid sensor histidine kinase/response regulator [Aggregatilineales bacterium]|nr:hybrid sensor histidine kinase/response regulator [Aggregatilineales bacterium]
MKKAAQGSLLVVDDNEMNRDMLSRRLKREGYTVTIAEDGHQAMDLIKTHKFDLILLDIMMPGISGFEMLPIIRQTYSIADLPIIMATAKDQSEDIVEGLKLGANDYVTKPIDFPVLLARIQIHLQLRALAQLKDEFLRIASHDLKNPLSTILMSAHIVHDKVPPGSAMTEQFYNMLGFIVRRGEEMQRIIHDFLDFQAMEDGKVGLDMRPTSLNEIAQDVVQNNQDYAKSKEISLYAELDQSVPEVNADGARLAQVMQNMVGNAVKFSQKGSVAVVRTVMDNGSVVLEVCDSGPGLTDDDLERAFAKYARLSNKPTGGESSSGLGLAICKQMIDLHGGKIGVHNNSDRGATFWFSIPVSQS